MKIDTADYNGETWILTPWQKGLRFGINSEGVLRTFDTRTPFTNLEHGRFVSDVFVAIDTTTVRSIESILSECFVRNVNGRLVGHIRKDSITGNRINQVLSQISQQAVEDAFLKTVENANTFLSEANDQFSTPAEPATGGVLDERFWECRCTLGDPHFHQDSPRNDHAPQSPKGVVIELTETQAQDLYDFVCHAQMVNPFPGSEKNEHRRAVMTGDVARMLFPLLRMEETPVGYAIVLHGGELFGIGFAKHSIETSIQEKGWELTGSNEFWSWKELLGIDPNPVVVFNPTKEG